MFLHKVKTYDGVIRVTRQGKHWITDSGVRVSSGYLCDQARKGKRIAVRYF